MAEAKERQVALKAAGGQNTEGALQVQWKEQSNPTASWDSSTTDC